MQRGNSSAESPRNQQNNSDKYHCFSLTSIILFKKVVVVYVFLHTTCLPFALLERVHVHLF